MKKFYSLIAALLFIACAAQSQCVIDSNAQQVPGVNPTADQLPCVIRGEVFDQTLQGKIQQGEDVAIVHIEVDSVSIDSIGGLPDGIVWSKNPDVLLGGANGCLQLTGTTNAPAGHYELAAYGTAWLRVTQPFPFSRAVNGNLNRFSPFGGYFLTVINPGDACVHATGINDFNGELNTALSLYPNPSNGVFTLKLNAGKRINGEITVTDCLGRTVFAQPLDAAGLYSTTIDLSNFSRGIYTVQLKTAEGFASKNISVE
jgi:hypothetical protein